jgi:flagellar protein FliS
MGPSENTYLEAQIMTATPQKLRLMLIDGALRFARQSVELREQGQNEPALESLIRCRSIVAELLSGIQVNQSELTRRVAAIYSFLFRSLTEAHLTREPSKVQDVVRVLEIERETWQQVCDQMPTAPGERPRSRSWLRLKGSAGRRKARSRSMRNGHHGRPTSSAAAWPAGS